MTNASPQPANPGSIVSAATGTRARDDARAYINWPDVPNEEDAFFASGKADYDRYVPTFLKKMNFDPRDKVALEIGCGIGRIARWMSQDFARYIGVDVSPEMIHKASSYNFPRAEFHAVSGGDLAASPTTAWISSGPLPCSSMCRTNRPSSIIFGKRREFCGPAEFFVCT